MAKNNLVLTIPQRDRMRDALASGPLIEQDGDRELIEMGLLESEGVEDANQHSCVSASQFATKFFYDAQGWINRMFTHGDYNDGYRIGFDHGKCQGELEVVQEENEKAERGEKF